MELWISGTIDECAQAANDGLAATIATNPILIAQWTKEGRSLEQVVTEAVGRVSVPVYVQLHGPTVDEYLAEMDALRTISDRIYPKLVAGHAGIAAAYQLARRGFRPLVTAVTTVNQAFMAASVGATYVAPYFGRIEDASVDAVGLIEKISDLFAREGSETAFARRRRPRPRWSRERRLSSSTTTSCSGCSTAR